MNGTGNPKWDLPPMPQKSPPPPPSSSTNTADSQIDRNLALEREILRFKHDSVNGNSNNNVNNSNNDKGKKEIQNLSLFQSLSLFFECFWKGFKDAVDIVPAIFIIYSSKKIQKKLFYIFLLNSIIFIGSIHLFNHIIHPFFNSIFYFLGLIIQVEDQSANNLVNNGQESSIFSFLSSFIFTDNFVQQQHYQKQIYLKQLEIKNTYESGYFFYWFSSLLSFFYYSFWIYPIYVFSFIVNGFSFQEIANYSYQLQIKSKINQKNLSSIQSPAEEESINEKSSTGLTYKKFIEQCSSNIYKSLILFNFYILSMIVYSILPNPIGPFLSFCMFSLHSSFYSFEFKWKFKNWSLQQQMNVLEEHWIYFLGFGFPCTVLNFFYTPLISAGIFSSLFPIYIILASTVKPAPLYPNQIQTTLIPVRLPIFKLSKYLNNIFLNFINSILESNRQSRLQFLNNQNLAKKTDRATDVNITNSNNDTLNNSPTDSNNDLNQEENASNKKSSKKLLSKSLSGLIHRKK